LNTALESLRKPVKVRVNTQKPATVGRSIAVRAGKWISTPATTGAKLKKRWKKRVKPTAISIRVQLQSAVDRTIHLRVQIQNRTPSNPSKLFGMLFNNFSMLKAASAVIASLALAAPAVAGPYANIENNAGWAGSDFGGHTTDFHIGYEGGNDLAGFYIQAGPSYVQPDNADGETILTGKIGGSVAATDKLGVYGELSMASGDTKSYGSKVGVKYKF
jgi:hypothetical protein